MPEGTLPEGMEAEAPTSIRIAFMVPEDRTTAFTHAARDMASVAGSADGAQGVDIVAAETRGRDRRWLVTIRFGDPTAAEAWRRSDEAARWRGRLEDLARDGADPKVRRGMEIWFDGSATGQPDRPPRYKVALLSILGIYPALLALEIILEPIERALPGWARTLVSVCVLSSLVTWIIMPGLTRLFSGWLFPPVERTP